MDGIAKNTDDQDALVKKFNEFEADLDRARNPALIELQDAAYELGRKRGRAEAAAMRVSFTQGCDRIPLLFTALQIWVLLKLLWVFKKKQI